MEYATLGEYTKIAQKIICKFAPKFYLTLASEILQNDDAFGEIVTAIINADWKYRDGKGSSKRTLRTCYARNAIRDYLNRKNKEHKTISLSYENPTFYAGGELSGVLEDKRFKDPAIIAEEKDNNRHLNNMIDENNLTDKQKNYIRSYYLNDNTLQKVGEIYGVSAEAIRQQVGKGIKKIQKNTEEQIYSLYREI